MSKPAKIRIILADDHAMFRQGIRRIICEISGWSVVGEVSNGIDLLEMLRAVEADLVVLDISMPGMRGLEAAVEIRSLFPKVKILILTMHHNQEYLRNAFEAGVAGFLLKEDADDELITAIRVILDHKPYLSPLVKAELGQHLLHSFKTGVDLTFESLTTREREVLKLIAEGKSSKQIAALFHISVRTVQNHRFNLMRKLGMNNITEVVKYALQRGLTSMNPPV